MALYDSRALDEQSKINMDHSRQIHLLRQQEKDLMHQLKSVEGQLDGREKGCNLYIDLRQKYERKCSDLDKATHEHQDLLQTSKNLEKRLQQMEIKEVETFQVVQKSIEKVEEALLERDKAISMGQQANVEIQRLNERLNASQQRWRDKMDQELLTYYRNITLI
jgi:vacuolar-type H+-ATPase subunit I/STV1